MERIPPISGRWRIYVRMRGARGGWKDGRTGRSVGGGIIAIAIVEAVGRLRYENINKNQPPPPPPVSTRVNAVPISTKYCRLQALEKQLILGIHLINTSHWVFFGGSGFVDLISAVLYHWTGGPVLFGRFSS